MSRHKLRAIVLEPLPLPPRELSPNRRVGLHYRTRAKLVKEYRESVGWFCKGKNRGEPLERASIQVTAWLRDKRSVLDGDNCLAWLKSLFDGLQDGGVLATDRNVIHYPPIQEINRDKAGFCRVVIHPSGEAPVLALG